MKQLLIKILLIFVVLLSLSVIPLYIYSFKIIENNAKLKEKEINERYNKKIKEIEEKYKM